MSHAKLFSPSKAEGWFTCAGRPTMEASFPDEGNKASDNGTARHAVCAYCLLDGETNAADLVGYYVRLADGHVFMPNVDDDLAGSLEYLDDWVAEDQDYVDTVRAMREGGELFIEQRLDFRRFVDCADPEDGFGTGDAVILAPIGDEGAITAYEIIVVDRKTGYHEVPVERNKQLMLYALGAYDEHSLVYDIRRVRLVIHQRAAREWDCSVEDLLAFGEEARAAAKMVSDAAKLHADPAVDPQDWNLLFLNPDPSESACAYCKAMATCPAMLEKVQDSVGADFDAIVAAGAAPAVDTYESLSLGNMMAATGLIEDWIKAVRAEVERRLLAGQQVEGFGLELGREGARQWADPVAAEAMLVKTFRLPVEKAYDLKPISPTSTEKLHKAGDIGPKQWAKLQPLICRAPAKPSVKPASVIKNPYTPPAASADDFQPVAEEAAELC